MPKSKTKRKAGGQPGNKNALKHGFYSELLTKAELARLMECKDIDLDDETGILRVLVHRLAETVATIDTANIDEARKTVNTISNAVQVINTTQRTKLLARGNGGEIAKTIMEALLSLDPYKEL